MPYHLLLPQETIVSLIPSKPIRILSVEDHPVFREGLATIIGSQKDMLLIAQAANANEAVAQFRAHRPDVTLMDVRLSGRNGTDALVNDTRRVSGRPGHHADHVG